MDTGVDEEDIANWTKTHLSWRWCQAWEDSSTTRSSELPAPSVLLVGPAKKIICFAHPCSLHNLMRLKECESVSPPPHLVHPFHCVINIQCPHPQLYDTRGVQLLHYFLHALLKFFGKVSLNFVINSWGSRVAFFQTSCTENRSAVPGYITVSGEWTSWFRSLRIPKFKKKIQFVGPNNPFCLFLHHIEIMKVFAKPSLRGIRKGILYADWGVGENCAAYKVRPWPWPVCNITTTTTLFGIEPILNLLPHCLT